MSGFEGTDEGIVLLGKVCLEDRKRKERESVCVWTDGLIDADAHPVAAGFSRCLVLVRKVK